MPRIPPSEAVKLIARYCPFTDDPTKVPNLGWTEAKTLAAIISAIDAIPGELLTVDAGLLTEFIDAVAVVRYFTDECRTLGNNAKGIPGTYLTTLRQVLEKCPDRAVPATIATLAFVTDPQFRDGLRADITSVEGSIRDADWKPATVMAGSVIEALLLWALQPPQKTAAEVTNQVAACMKTGMPKPRGAAVEEWDLHHYIEVNAGLGTIKADTAAQLRIARDFRNLIHPGRVVRLAMKCNRGTALAAAAGLEFVIRDLTPP